MIVQCLNCHYNNKLDLSVSNADSMEVRAIGEYFEMGVVCDKCRAIAFIRVTYHQMVEPAPSVQKTEVDGNEKQI